jgi:hypothetical protein
MAEGQWDYANACDLQGLHLSIKKVKIELGNPTSFDRYGIENIGKFASEVAAGPLVSVGGDRGFLRKIEGPDLVYPVRMIGMGMGVKYRVEPGDVVF